jgi:hypothetical protein
MVQFGTPAVTMSFTDPYAEAADDDDQVVLSIRDWRNLGVVTTVVTALAAHLAVTP